MKPERKIYIELKEFKESPQFVSEKLGLNPFWFGLKGEPFCVPGKEINPKRIYDCNFWKYQTESYRDLEFEELLDNLLFELEPIKNQITQMTTSCFGQVVFVSYEGHYNLNFRLRKDQIETISELGLQISFDLYSTSSENNA